MAEGNNQAGLGAIASYLDVPAFFACSKENRIFVLQANKSRDG